MPDWPLLATKSLAPLVLSFLPSATSSKPAFGFSSKRPTTFKRTLFSRVTSNSPLTFRFSSWYSNLTSKALAVSSFCSMARNSFSASPSWAWARGRRASAREETARMGRRFMVGPFCRGVFHLIEHTTSGIGPHRGTFPTQAGRDCLEYRLMRCARAAAWPRFNEEPAAFHLAGKVGNDTARPERRGDSPGHFGQRLQVLGGGWKALRSGQQVEVMERPREGPPVHDPDPNLLRHRPVDALAGSGEVVPFARQDQRIPTQRSPEFCCFRFQLGPVLDPRNAPAQLQRAVRRADEQGVRQVVRQRCVKRQPPRLGRGHVYARRAQRI